jgi:hypothetical protein
MTNRQKIIIVAAAVGAVIVGVTAMALLRRGTVPSSGPETPGPSASGQQQASDQPTEAQLQDMRQYGTPAEDLVPRPAPATEPAPPDADRDSLSDELEVQYKTDPQKPDTDGDGWEDGYEVFFTHTDPLKPDAAARGR